MSRNNTLLILAGFGLLVSSYLLYQYLQPAAMFCPGGGAACDIVKNSPYSNLFGIPLPYWGVFYFVFTIVYLVKLELIALNKLFIPNFVPSFIKDNLDTGLAVLILFGVLFESYYTYLQLFVIDAICVWCLLIQVTLIGMFIVLVNDYYFLNKSENNTLS